MGQRAITIYTPSMAAPHITADDDAFTYASLAGLQSGILGDLTCVKVDNNTVRLSGGGAMNRGHILRIPTGENLDLTVATGSAGATRYDSVVAEFVKGGGDTADSYQIKVVQGTTSPPALTQSTLTATGNVNQVELYRIYISGTTLSTITQIAEKILKSPKITYGTAKPSGGNDGDIYFKIVE